MARAKTKIDLMVSAQENFEKMILLIDSLPEEVQLAPFSFVDRDQNIKDVLVHLYEWHLLLINWIVSNQSGKITPFLPSPYNWKTYGLMNIDVIWKKHVDTSYLESREMLIDSHHKVMKIIDTFSNDELFLKGYFTWTKTTTLGSYCVSASASHYDWAINKINKHIKQKIE